MTPELAVPTRPDTTALDPRRSRGAPALAIVLALTAAACVSGRVLSGYPGYPFTSFTVSRTEEELFPAMTEALEEEGYAIDFTDRGSGFIQTRLGPDRASSIFLNVVIGSDPEAADHAVVWVAGFERRRGGDRRINPLDEVLWEDVMEVSRGLSRRLGGTRPVGPDERPSREPEEGRDAG